MVVEALPSASFFVDAELHFSALTGLFGRKALLWNDWMLLNLQVVVQRMVFYLFTPAAAAITAQTCVVPVCLVDSDDLLEIWNVLH